MIFHPKSSIIDIVRSTIKGTHRLRLAGAFFVPGQDAKGGADMSNKGGRVSVLVRMSPDMRDKIQRAARRNGVNAWMLDAAAAHLGAPDSTAKQPEQAKQKCCPIEFCACF